MSACRAQSYDVSYVGLTLVTLYTVTGQITRHKNQFPCETHRYHSAYCPLIE